MSSKLLFQENKTSFLDHITTEKNFKKRVKTCITHTFMSGKSFTIKRVRSCTKRSQVGAKNSIYNYDSLAIGFPLYIHVYFKEYKDYENKE